MNRLKIVASAAILSLSAAGCQTLPDNASVIDRIQAAAIAACGYVPTAEFVLELLDLDWQGADRITSIVDAICAALAPSPAARSAVSAAPAVGGVPVQGQFVGR